MLVEFFILIVWKVWVSQAKVWFSTTSETQNKLNNTHYVTVLSTCVCWVYVRDALPLSIEFLCMMYNMFSSTNISPEDIFQEIAFLWFNIFWQLVISCGSKSLKDPTKATKRVSKVMKKKNWVWLADSVQYTNNNNSFAWPYLSFPCYSSRLHDKPFCGIILGWKQNKFCIFLISFFWGHKCNLLASNL